MITLRQAWRHAKYSRLTLFLCATSIISKKLSVPPLSPVVLSKQKPKRRSRFNQKFVLEEIQHFDANYASAKKVEVKSLRKGVLVEHIQYNDIDAILDSKLQDDPAELINFVKIRGPKIRLAEVWYFVKKIVLNHNKKQQYLEAVDEEVLDIISEFLKNNHQNITPIMAGSILKVCTTFRLSNQIILAVIGLYLRYLSKQPNISIDIQTILECPPIVLAECRSTLTQALKRNPEYMMRVFLALTKPLPESSDDQTEAEIFNSDIVRLYDQYFHEHIDAYSLEDKTRLLEGFCYIGKRGFFVQDIEEQLKNIWMDSLAFGSLLKIVISLSTMRVLDQNTFQKIQNRAINELLEGALSIPQTVILIQVAHLSNFGSLEFWTLLRNQKIKYRYNQAFAILGGYERNLSSEISLFLDMVSRDPQHESFSVGLNQDQFLKMALVYTSNLQKVEPESLRKSISSKICEKLKLIYKQRPYKIFIMMMLWLVEPDPQKRQEWFKLMYTNQLENLLLGFAFPEIANRYTADHSQQKVEERRKYEEILSGKYEYWNTHRRRAVVEEYIRRKMAFFQKNKHWKRSQD